MTLAFGSKVIIQTSTFDTFIKVLLLMTKLFVENLELRFKRVDDNVVFPISYNSFAVEYNMILARVKSYYLSNSQVDLVYSIQP